MLLLLWNNCNLFLFRYFYIRQMNWPTNLSEFSVTKNKRLNQVRADFMRGLDLQCSRPEVAYYDFLLVAKQIGLRFEEAKHLMSLKSYFLQNNNCIQKQKLCSLLMLKCNNSKDKFIVKFALPHHMSLLPPIEEEDEQQNQAISKEIKKKKQILINIKVQQFEKIIPVVIELSSNFPELSYQDLRKALKMRNIKIASEESLRTIYECTQSLKQVNQQSFLQNLKDTLNNKINEEMLGSVLMMQKKSGVKLLHTVEPNILELEIQNCLTSNLNQQTRKNFETRRKTPIFGPLKLHKKRQKQKQQGKIGETIIEKSKLLITKENIADHKQRIDKLINQNKSVRQYDFDTNANRLRRLFIENVILPFERKNDEQIKKRYCKSSSVHLEVSAQKIS